jgi:predicted  nucleic acid-binding Zn-ribbon protein
LLKGCTRCGGDVVVDRDEHGWYQECLQCGWMADYRVAAEARESPRRKRRVRRRELCCLAPAAKDGKL